MIPAAKPLDVRNIRCGWPIPTLKYCDQPYVVRNPDGSWCLVLTTGNGVEGEPGQHVMSMRSTDQGRTWHDRVAIEPPDGPEASWAMPLLVPDTGRIYVFYTYNQDNLRSVLSANGDIIERVDTLGVYAYRSSDDGGRSWSSDRFEIPMRHFACDRSNTTGGSTQFFWGIGKPFIHHGAAFVCATKVGNFGWPGFFLQNEGVLFRCPNLLTEHDPSKHVWETLPEGEVGLRAPPDGGPIAGEFNATPMNDGSLYGTFRTIDGFSCHTLSRDDGRSWEVDWMRYRPGGRRVKNPRSANVVRRYANGKYLYWFCFHGGERLGREQDACSYMGYGHRNPIWICGGEERDGGIRWSEPEVLLYSDTIGDRMSYPDFLEEPDGRIFYTETNKTIARVHQIDPAILDAVWRGEDRPTVATDGLVLDYDAHACATGTVDLPTLPTLHNRDDTAHLDVTTGATITGETTDQVTARGGCTLELYVRFDHLAPWQVLFDSRDEEGCGLFVQLTDRGTVKLHIAQRAYDTPGARWGNGVVESCLDCEEGLLTAGQLHQLCFIIDGGPKLLSVVVDGQLCDGGRKRQAGWSHFHPNLREPNGAAQATLGSSLHGSIERLRVYDRYLLSNQAAANWRASISPGTT